MCRHDAAVFAYGNHARFSRARNLIKALSRATFVYLAMQFYPLKSAKSPEKYGKPANHREYIEDAYSSYPLLGLQTGKGEYVSYWKTPDLDIALILKGDNFKISFAL